MSLLPTPFLPTPCQEDIDRLESLDYYQLRDALEKAMDDTWSEIVELDPVNADREPSLEALQNGVGSLLILLWEAGRRIA